MNSNLFKKGLLVFLVFLLFIISRCKDTTLVTTKEDEEYELELLMHDIQSMSAQVSCTDASEWRIASFGVLSCGGSARFVAYSTKIDTAYFLKKLEKYTSMQAAYNKKWKIVSPCALVLPPKGVACVEGKATLVY